MSHFYGTMQGQAGEATRRGSRLSGLSMHSASWEGSVSVRLSEKDGVDYATVSLQSWKGKGVSLLLYDGPISGPIEGKVSSELVTWFSELAEKEEVQA